jgi:FkbM family methyltransferase
MNRFAVFFNRIIAVFGLIATRRVNVIPLERLNRARRNIFDSLDIQFVMDIGANSGQWAKSVRRNGYKGLLISVEPTREAFSILSAESVMDQNWKTFNCAIDVVAGSRKIMISSNEGLSSSFFDLMEDHKKAAPEVELFREELVDTCTLESLIKSHGIPRMYLKIDTQGSELLVLKSIDEETFSKIFAIEIEISLVGTYLQGPLIEEVISYLRARNFRPYRIENGLARSNFGQQVQVDFIFIQNELSDLVA